MWQGVTGMGIGLVILIVITHSVLSRSRKTHFYFSFAVAHLIFIGICSLIYAGGSRDALHQLFWVLPSMIDWPISKIVPTLAYKYMSIMAISLAVLGTIQYALAGLTLDVVWSLIKGKQSDV